jgi:hypothetical protein
MRLRDLGLVCVDKGSVAHDRLTADDQAVDAMGACEDDARHAIVGPAELEAVRPPHGEVGALAGLE